MRTWLSKCSTLSKIETLIVETGGRMAVEMAEVEEISKRKNYQNSP